MIASSSPMDSFSPSFEASLDAAANPSQPGSTPLSRSLVAADDFVALIRELELKFARRGDTVPQAEERRAVRDRYWSLVERISEALVACSADRVSRLVDELRRRVGPSVWRSSFYRHSYSRPHGYAGDYRMIEQIYDLEEDGWVDETLPGVVNLMEDLFVSHASVSAVWERRHYLADVVRERLATGDYTAHRPLRLLDIACGGARYLRDVLEEFGPDALEITVIDQDPSALAYVRTRALAPWADQVRIERARISRLARIEMEQNFDLIFSAGLFDYLNERSGQKLLSQAASWLAPEGEIVISNFRSGDLCHVSQHVFGAWDLITRDDDEFCRLFPAELSARATISANGSLLFGRACHA